MNEKALRVRYQKNKVKKERWKMYDVIIIGAGGIRRSSGERIVAL